MAEDKTIQCVADCRALLGEGPVWVEREAALYWLDIKGRRIFRRGFEGGEVTSWEAPLRIGSLAPRIGGGFIAGTEDGFALVDPAETRFDIIGDPEPEHPANRFNDGKLDRQGRFWAGTMDDREQQPSGALYRVDADQSWVRMDEGYKVTNGPAFSPDGRLMYHNDSARQTVYLFDIDDAGTASNKRVFARFGEGDGYPDGMTVDAEGCLWIAFWDGWCLRRFSAQGDCIGTIKVPVQRPTSCVFAGPGLDHLFVTSARIGLDEKAIAMQPYAGGLFLLRPGVNGIADTLFAG